MLLQTYSHPTPLPSSSLFLLYFSFSSNKLLSDWFPLMSHFPFPLYPLQWRPPPFPMLFFSLPTHLVQGKGWHVLSYHFSFCAIHLLPLSKKIFSGTPACFPSCWLLFFFANFRSTLVKLSSMTSATISQSSLSHHLSSSSMTSASLPLFLSHQKSNHILNLILAYI
jgi:hypothetical protein